MTDQATGDSAHPYRVLVPVVSLEAVCDALEMPTDKRGLLRSRDQMHPYLYLPAMPGTDEGELVALLFRPTTVSEEFLRNPPRRLAQLHPLARRYVKVKLAAYSARARIDPETLPIVERDEAPPGEPQWPPSLYDPPSTEFADRTAGPRLEPRRPVPRHAATSRVSPYRPPCRSADHPTVAVQSRGRSRAGDRAGAGVPVERRRLPGGAGAGPPWSRRTPRS